MDAIVVGKPGVSTSEGGTITPTYHLRFDGSGDYIVVPADATLNNLPLGDFTIEWSGRSLPVAPLNGYIFRKANPDDVGVAVFFTGTGLLAFTVVLDLGYTTYVQRILSVDSQVHHYEFVYWDSPRDMKIFIDGVEATYNELYTVTDTAETYPSDAAHPVELMGWSGGSGYDVTGTAHWFRVSNIARHSANFTQPSLIHAPDDDANTVLLLALNEGTGTAVADTSGNGNDGTITAATWVNDATTYHLDFDGVDDVVTVAAAASINNLGHADFTLDMSVTFPAESHGYIFFKADNEANAGIYLYRSNTPYEGGLDAFVVVPGDMAVNSYYNAAEPLNVGGVPHHLEVTFDFSELELKIYVDGVLIDVTYDYYAYPSAGNDDTRPLFIGKDTSTDPVPGSVYWLRISDNIRHTANFTPPSLITAPADDANTVLLLRMEDGFGATVYDASGNANNGTITGATWTVD